MARPVDVVALPAARAGRRARIPVASVAAWTVTTALAALFLIPFAWMLSTSLKSERELFAFPISWIPRAWQFSNFPVAWTTAPFTQYAVNTVVITVATLIGQTVSSALAAYAFARLRFHGRDALFFTVLAVMMLPAQVTIIPLFILFREMQWINTFYPLIVPGFFGEAFFIFLLRQFFLTIPPELEDAARIDGASSLQILLHIIAPLSRAALATVAVFSFMHSWNDYFAPLLYLNSNSKKTLALGLAAFRGEYQTQWHLMMAASLLILLPCLILFFLMQRHFIEGIATGGVKD
jgi:multiple sugar transport system permease protein